MIDTNPLFTAYDMNPLYISQDGSVTCKSHAGRYLTNALKNDPFAETIDTPLDNWIRVSDETRIAQNVTCDHCKPNTNPEVFTMAKSDTTIAVPVRKTAKKATTAKKAPAKKETTAPAKTTVKKPVAKKTTAAAKKTETQQAAAKTAPKKATPRTPKLFLVYRNIESDVPAQTRKSKSFDPIRYEGVIEAASITSARKKLTEVYGEDAGKYDVAYSYDDQMLTQKALRVFNDATERVTAKGKGTFNVILKNTKGLAEEEAQELALYAWIVDAAKKAPKPTGNERMLDREFKFESCKSLKNDRKSITFTTN